MYQRWTEKAGIGEKNNGRGKMKNGIGSEVKGKL